MKQSEEIQEQSGLLQIYNHFGQEKQLEKLQEEVNELIEAVKIGDKEHITEEIADVLVLINQIAKKYKIENIDVMPVYVEKIKRTLNRMESKYYEQEE